MGHQPCQGRFARLKSAEADPDHGAPPAVYRDTNLQILFCVTLVAVMSVSSITPALPGIAQVLGVSAQQVALLITAFTLPGVFLTPLLGVLADRWGRKPVLAPSLFLFALAGTACAFCRDFPLLLALRFGQGIGAAALGALNVTIIGDLYSGRRRAAAMGYNASVLNVGTASYPAIGGALATLAWYAPFFLPLLAVPVGLLVVFRLHNPEPRNHEDLGLYLRTAWASIRRREVVGLFVVGVATFILLYGAYLSYFPFLLRNRFGASPLLIGAMMSTMSLTTAITASQMGRLTKRFSERTLIRAAFVLYAIALPLIPLMPTIWLLPLPILVFGVGQGINMPSVQTLLASLAPIEHRAAFMSINGTVLRLGQTLGPLVMGVVFALWGASWPFYAGAILSLLMVGLLAVTIRQLPAHQPAQTPGVPPAA
ncbi:MAG: MFS transporter [Chloroflexi bacterium]|nr:MFS transporter [Chloroflexota bacterium]